MINTEQAKAQESMFRKLRTHYNLGSIALGKLLDIPRASMYRYEKGRLVLPMDTALSIEKTTRGVVKRHEMYPNLFKGYEVKEAIVN